jgi:hypothetical protein
MVESSSLPTSLFWSWEGRWRKWRDGHFFEGDDPDIAHITFPPVLLARK